jgi:hypothetical protein
MRKYEYLILVAQAEASLQTGVVWKTSEGRMLGPNLPGILNDLGREGWEVVAAADLVFGPRPDILLKRALL